jgi:hypothetical protein
LHLLTELHYLPSVAYLREVAGADAVLLEAHENYTKGSCRNRCHIATGNGILRLSVPLLQGKNQQQNIRAVRIANDTAWQRQHWRSIATAYSSSAFWWHYAPKIAPLFEREYEFLFDWNYDVLMLLLAIFDIKTPILLTESYTEIAPEGVHDCRNKWQNDIIPLAKMPHYPQVFEDKQGFLPNMSALDILFCMGAQGANIGNTKTTD